MREQNETTARWSASARRRRARNRGGGAIRMLLLTAAVISCVVWAGGAAASSGVVTLLHVNDTHSYLDAYGPKDHFLDGTVGGMEKAASVIMAERAASPDALLLHAGDLFQGDFFFNAYFGVPELQLMQQLGFDAMAVGNHEFALGPDVLALALSEGDADGALPLLSANLDMSGYPVLQNWIQPSIMKEVEGVTIGIFGMTTPDDPMEIPAPVVILGAGDPATVMGIAGMTAAGLRAAGADVVICLSHLGLTYDPALAANVPGIDIIVGGHTHDALEQPLEVTNPEGKTTLILQAGSHYRYVGRLRFTFEDGAVHMVDYALLPVDKHVDPLPEAEGVVDNLKLGIESIYGDVYHLELARAPRDIKATTNPKTPWRDSGMGNLITDAYRAKTNTEIAITADGLISGEISKGPVVGRDLFRCLSYGYDTETGLDFKLVTFDITGVELVKALETALGYADVDADFFLQVSGMRFAYDSRRDPGERVLLRSIFVGPQPLEPDRTYSVTVDEAAAMLIPMMGVEVTNVQPWPDLEYNVLRDFVLDHQHLLYGSRGRIRDVAIHRRCRVRQGWPPLRRAPHLMTPSWQRSVAPHQ
jgi:5'-nucleotidase / UDP-sugar diphosphatase